MKLDEYQEKAMSTCLPTCDNFAYMFTNLVGEMGEFASKIAKRIRKNNMYIEDNNLVHKEHVTLEDAEEFERELQLEIGDCLWQMAGLCYAKGWSLEEVAQMNLDKLASRKKRGVIDGEGDFR